MDSVIIGERKGVKGGNRPALQDEYPTFGQTPLYTGCPTITDSNKKTTKRRHLRPLNRKRRNYFITGSNCRTASKGQGIRDPLRSHSNKGSVDI